ncbi:flavin-binding monooxygenase [Lentzea sp. NBRC 105346]|uniref:flavin-containing monooxygenase n=1 Tax=Lentzea sp. NBRC 105346 TaxID=3032205 RepID=UPI0024A4F730|nr:NAD(P)-binding domain-containing protein [Lentzea sp. NBRC 105346]GLZ33467.1 flavin-binding monooxygenase [Lentzea sp. NBRC 105346]
MIGAGLAGLAVAKTLRERNSTFTVLEQTSGVGGLWRSAAERVPSPGYAALHLNTSAKVSAFSYFPMPESYPRYPRHDLVADYLGSFSAEFGLNEHVEFETEVVDVARNADSTWNVRTRERTSGQERVRTFRHVVVATGHHWHPKWPEPAIPGAEDFPGEQLHSFDYHSAADHVGKRVVVAGFGNSAADISVDLSRLAKETYLSIRRSLHVTPKTMFGIPIDEIASAGWWARMGFEQQRRFVELVLRVVRGRLTDYGIPEPDHRIFSSPVTISDELLSRISHGDITVRPVIERFDGSEVVFADGSHVEADTVVYCTGYRIVVPFLPDEWYRNPAGQITLYHRVVPPHLPGLYFAGFIRPVGSITRLLEGQAEWIADLVEGSVILPDAAEMTEEIDRHLEGALRRYGPSETDSVQVDFAPYLETLLTERRARAGSSRAG